MCIQMTQNEIVAIVEQRLVPIKSKIIFHFILSIHHSVANAFYE